MSSLDRTKFDSTLYSMLQQHSDEVDFLNSIFGFLQRKTPCFNGPNAEKNFGILIQTLQVQLGEYKRQTAPESAEAFAAAKAAAIQRESAAAAPAAVAPKVQKVEEKRQPAAAPAPAPPPAAASAPTVATSAGAAASASAGDESKEDEPRVKLPGNGGRTEKYTWTQTLQEVSVSIPVPAGVTSKMLNVKITSKNIEVGVKGGETIVAGPLHASVQLDECLWLLDKNCVDVTLSKVRARRLCCPRARYVA